MGKPGVMFYFNMRPSSRLSDAERLQLYDAVLDYSKTGQAPSFSGALSVAWDYIQPTLDEDNLRYEETRKKRASSGSKGGLAKARNAKQAAAKLANLANSIQFNTTELNKKTGEDPPKDLPPVQGQTGEAALVGGSPARFYYDPVQGKVIDREETLQ